MLDDGLKPHISAKSSNHTCLAVSHVEKADFVHIDNTSAAKVSLLDFITALRSTSHQQRCHF